MNFKQLASIVDANGAARARLYLLLGVEVDASRRPTLPSAQLPRPLRRPHDLGAARAWIESLHGLPKAEAAPYKSLDEVFVGELTIGPWQGWALPTRVRCEHARQALRKANGETVADVAVRLLGLGLADPDPTARVCAALAYYRATGAQHVAVPLLVAGLKNDDEDARMSAAAALESMDQELACHATGDPADDEPLTGTPLTEVESQTVLIHGTFSKNDAYYQPPRGYFFEYIRDYVFPDVYGGADFFYWSGRACDEARQMAAVKLISWCNLHPARTLRLIGHSHGANVANIATQLGLKVCTMVHLSPPVLDEYLPDVLGHVSSRRFFNFHPGTDLVVTAIAGAEQVYDDTSVDDYAYERQCALAGHGKSHEPRIWDRHPAFVQKVRSTCP